LDDLSGELSRDGRHLHGSLIDGARLRGQWKFTRIKANSRSYAESVKDLLTDSAISHWEGKIGSAQASLDIFPRPASEEWTARGTYDGVMENLSVLVQDDGTIVLNGRSYEPQSRSVAFPLSTFYGQLSDDGSRMQGLRIDASGRRESWRIVKTRTDME
jgi:hypothetical protein